MMQTKQSASLPSINMNHTLTTRLDTFSLSNQNYSNLYYQLGPQWDPKSKIKQANESYRTIVNGQHKPIIKFKSNHPINPGDTSYLSFYKEANPLNAMNNAKINLNNPLLFKSNSKNSLFPTLLDIFNKKNCTRCPKKLKECVVNINEIKLPIKKTIENSFNRTIILKKLNYVHPQNSHRDKLMKTIRRKYLDADLPIDEGVEDHKNLKQYEMKEYYDKKKVIPFK